MVVMWNLEPRLARWSDFARTDRNLDFYVKQCDFLNGFFFPPKKYEDQMKYVYEMDSGYIMLGCDSIEAGCTEN